MRRRWSGFLLVLTLLMLWQAASEYGILLDPRTIPPVTDILRAWTAAMEDGSLESALLGTLLRFAVGFALAVAVGITVGCLLGYSQTMYALLEPAVELLRPLPPPAIVPALILLLGFENRMKIAAVVFAACFPMIVNTLHGIRAVDPVLIDTAHTFGYRGIAVLRRVILPAALPAIFVGMRISLAVSLIVVVVAEMLAGSTGIGYFIKDAEQSFYVARMFAGIFTLAVLGYTMNWLFMWAERMVLPWWAYRIQP